MCRIQAIAPEGQYLDSDTVIQTLTTSLEGHYARKKILVLVPDHTRTLPLPFLFRTVVDILHNTKQLDFMVALGTHPPLPEAQLNRLVGITQQERETRFKHVGLLNHTWDSAEALTRIATLPKAQMQEIAGDSWHFTLGGDVPVNINRRIFDYDHIIILGPTFPHEVVGFSGGAKYLFPGISGPEMINVSHWLGALRGVVDTIGVMDTPVRAMIHAAADHVHVPVTLVSMAVRGKADLAGIFVGGLESAWRAAAQLSAEQHIVWKAKPFQRILSCAPTMYDELWTAAKAMYKLEPVLAAGGELIIYAPHLKTISFVHGKYILEAGYHVLAYFLAQWDKYKHIPLGVLAHSTHVRGGGRFENGIEYPDASVTLASRVPPDVCRQLALGYANPDEIDMDEWQDREDDSILLVPKAGEMLYRLQRNQADNSRR